MTCSIKIGLHKRDLSLLLQFQKIFDGIGSIHINPTREVVNFSVDSNKDLINLINHIKKYPLLTQKAADFLLFKQVVELINIKDHLTVEGLQKIINIKASMNLGLSDMLKSEFNEISPVERPVINTENIPDPNWFAGFVSGDGSFDINIPQTSNKIGHRVQLRFRITHHERDKNLLDFIIKYLGSGKIYKYSNKSAVSLTIVNFSDINNLIIPFFEKYPLIGVKLFDFLDWCKIANLMKDGSHLTIEGLALIRSIKAGMNTGRKYSSLSDKE